MSYDNLESYLDESNLDSGDSTDTVEVEAQDNQEVADGQPVAEPKGGDSLESQLDGVEAPTGDVLSMINDLGLIRNGMPFEYSDLEALKADIMKGHDYTAKTQELAEMRKQTEAELASMKQEFEQTRIQFEQEKAQVESSLIENEIFANLLTQLKVEEPHVFDWLAQNFQREMGIRKTAMSNPELSKVKSELDQLKKSLEGSKKQDETKTHEEIVKSWENGLKETQTAYAAKLRSLGVKPNWDKVKQIWIADSTNQMTVKQAMLAVHGEDISKALEAKSKLASVKSASAKRTNTSVVSGATEQTKPNNDYLALAEKYASQL